MSPPNRAASLRACRPEMRSWRDQSRGCRPGSFEPVSPKADAQEDRQEDASSAGDPEQYPNVKAICSGWCSAAVARVEQSPRICPEPGSFADVPGRPPLDVLIGQLHDAETDDGRHHEGNGADQQREPHVVFA